MNRNLNSISRSICLNKDKSKKEDSIIDLLQNSEIEFGHCPNVKNNLLDFNTGFGKNNDLHYESACKKPELKVPLYHDNYLSEFATEEEKAAARHALGLYNKNDVVLLSLLTAEDSLPSTETIQEARIKQLKKGDQFFTPVTSIKSVYTSKGVTLERELETINILLNKHDKDILNILQVSTSKEVTSLGDIRIFLQGFNNGDNLRKTIDTMNQEMIRFEQTGEIIT